VGRIQVASTRALCTIPALNVSSLTLFSWWKAKLKDEAGVTDGAVGLIPATYVEEVSVVSHSF
jgi:hypothetical protein